MQLRVYFSTLEVTKITETKKWDGENIVVGLGGTLSLFLGISFVAALEYAELAVRLVAVAVSELSAKSRVIRSDVITCFNKYLHRQSNFSHL